MSILRRRLSIYEISQTCIIQNLDNIVLKFVLKWLGFPIGANVTHLSLPTSKFGLNFKTISQVLKHCNVSTRKLLHDSQNADIDGLYDITKHKYLLEGYNKNLYNETACPSKLLQTVMNGKVNNHLETCVNRVL